MIGFLKRRLRERIVKRFDIPEIAPSLERAKANGLQPRYIFDVGANRGDFARTCRAIWPDAHISCFDVLQQHADTLDLWCRRDGNAEFFRTMIGETEKRSVGLHEMDTASSILDEHFDQKAPITFHPMTTIDTIASRSGRAPDLLKLDIQGYELAAFKGAVETLPAAKAVLAELSLMDIHRGVPLIDEVIVFLRKFELVAYDVCDLVRRPLDRALWTVDMLFVPLSSPLRMDKRWKATAD